MPSSEDSRDFIKQLPWALHRDMQRYLSAVRAKAPEIFRAAEVTQTRARLERLLFFAAIQKLWLTVESQTWVVDRTLSILDEGDGDGVTFRESRVSTLQIGRSTYSRSSPDFQQLVRLHADLESLLRRLEIKDLLHKPLPEIVRKLREMEVIS